METGRWRYEEITPNERGWLWCDSLGLWLGTWSGTILRETATWLRFYDAAGNLVKLSFKLSFELAEAERERATRAESELKLEQERVARAESELKQAQAEAARAQEQAERERQRAEKLAARLKELGIDPDM